MKVLKPIIVCLLGLCGLVGSAQIQQVAATTETGPLPFKTYSGGKFDSIQLQNGDLNFHVPLFDVPQLGRLSLSYSLVGQSDARVPAQGCDPYGGCVYYLVPAGEYSFGGPNASHSGERYNGIGAYIAHDQGVELADAMQVDSWTYYGSWYQGNLQYANKRRHFTLRDGRGGIHQMGYDSTDYSLLHAVDGSGWSLKLPVANSAQAVLDTAAAWPSNPVAYDAAGNKYEIGPNFVTNSDPSNNTISSSTVSVSDTLQRPISVSSADMSSCPNLGISDQQVTSSTIWSAPGPNGSTSTYRICYTSFQLKTNFWGGDGTDLYSPVYYYDDYGNQQMTASWWEENHDLVTAIQSVILPDNSKWSVIYDTPAVGAPFTYGDITEVRTPEGGALKYQYSSIPVCGENMSAGWYTNSPTRRAVTRRTASAGSGPDVVTDYLYDTTKTTETTAGNATEHIFTLDGSGGCGANETTTKYWQGSASSGALLKQIDTVFESVPSPQNQISIGDPGPFYSIPANVNARPTQLTTQLTGEATGTSSHVYESLFVDVDFFHELNYNNYGFVGSPVTIKYQEPSSSTDAVKTVESPSLFGVNGNYKAANLLTLKQYKKVYDSNGNLAAQTDFHYDENNGSPQGTLGNLTSTTSWADPSTSYTSSIVYNTQGMAWKSTDSRGTVTQADSFQCSGLFPASVTAAYGTSVANTVQQVNDCNTGALLQVTDANNVATVYERNDPLGRVTKIRSAAGVTGVESDISVQYPSRTQVTTAQDKSSLGDGALVSKTYYDGLGRIVTSVGPAGQLVETLYDNAGNIQSVSNPFYWGSQTSGYLSYVYDALGRKTYQYNQDGTNQHWVYSGSAVDFYDEGGRHWARAYDPLGSLTQVYEPDSSNNPTIRTDYAYDALGSLRTANQSFGARWHEFSYDYLSRLKQSYNPETGWICYGTTPGNASPNGSNCTADYDGNGNLLHKTDARGVVTSYSYDALNRLTGKSSVGTSYIYAYDIGQFGWNGTNLHGRLTYEADGSHYDRHYGYDAMGRVIVTAGATPHHGWGDYINAAYDLAGNLTSLTYPDGRKVAQTYDAAGRMASVQYESWNTSPAGLPYLTVDATAGYDPAGHLTAATFGNGMSLEAHYNERQEIKDLGYSKNGLLLWGRGFNWTNNGNLDYQMDPLTGYKRQFGYDNLNRLTSAIDYVGTTAPGGSITTGAQPSPGVGSGATNILPSDSLSLASWSHNEVTTEDAVVTAPDQTLTASEITAISGAADGYLAYHLSNASRYSNSSITGSVWLRTPSGTLDTYIYVVQTNSSGWSVPGVTAVHLTTSWQLFQVTATAQRELQDLIFQIGGGFTFGSGRIDVWGPKLELSPSNSGTRTNVLPYSQRLTGNSWGQVNATIVDNNAAAPDGTMTAATVTGQAADSYVGAFVWSPATYSNTTLTASVWVKVPNGTKTLGLWFVDNGLAGTHYLDSKMVTLSTTWQRVTLSGTTNSSISMLDLQIGGANTIGNGESIQVWGAQIEFGTSAGGYIATGSVPVSQGASLTNLLPYSQAIQNPQWGCASGCSMTANAATAPDGTQTATRIVAGGSGDSYALEDLPNPALYAGTQLTFSAYMRAPAGTPSIVVYLLNDGSAGWWGNGTAVTLSQNWQRVQVTYTIQSAPTRVYVQIGGSNTFTNSAQIEVWGAQVEANSSAGPYVKTLATPVTVGREFTNVLPYSQQMSGPTWIVPWGHLSSTTLPSPDGSNSASQITAENGVGDSYAAEFIPNPSLYSGATVTASVYLRVASGTKSLFLGLIQDGAYWTGTSTYVNLTTTWQRFDLTATIQTQPSSIHLQIGGAGTLQDGQSVQIWGAQIVQGSQPGNYQATPSVQPTLPLTGTPGAPVPNGLFETYTYDSFGNIKQAGNFNFWQNYLPNNRLAGYLYDAAGNMLSDGISNTMTWDAENRIATDNGTSYIYDAEGNRISKSGAGWTDTVYFAGKPIARVENGQWTDLIYGPTGLLAEVPGTQAGQPIYRMIDHLGTQVATADNSGLVSSVTDYAPFGQVFTGGSIDPYKFTGKERDTESGNDYFGARYYASTMGRWLSPDWADKPEAVPYSDLANPQSLNLYGYVNNNPLSHADVDGHCFWDLCVGEGVATYVAVGALVATTAVVAHNLHDYVSSGRASQDINTIKQSISDATSSITRSSEKTPPNPNGSKGAPDHQATADEEAATMGKNGEREVRIPTPGGAKGTRVADAAKVENGQVTAVTQVIRPKKNGEPPKREIEAARDIERALPKVKVKFVPVRPLPTQ